MEVEEEEAEEEEEEEKEEKMDIKGLEEEEVEEEMDLQGLEEEGEEEEVVEEINTEVEVVEVKKEEELSSCVLSVEGMFMEE